MSELAIDLSSVPAGEGYAGDILPNDVWSILTQNSDAVLVDVRTVAEWTFVGIPDLASLDRPLLTVEWSYFPSNQINPNFVDQIKEALSQINRDGGPVFFLCRSGVRSKSAAIAMTAAGVSPCYNISGGFEGDPDGLGRRASVNGWKMAGLPWRQA